MALHFLGTGGAWGLPELSCTCRICSEMRLRHEKRLRTALLFSGKTNLLIDCGPDIAQQLSGQSGRRVDGVLLTHEHGDHYLGLDDLSAFQRSRPRGSFQPIPLYVTAESWKTIGPRFAYLAQREVLSVCEVEPGKTYTLGEMEFTPFKTHHGPFAGGSVGYLLKTENQTGDEVRLFYTSDFIDLAEDSPEPFPMDYLIIQTYWLNEPEVNRPHHMSFQRAMDFISRWKPKKETFLVHIGDGDFIPGDPANHMMKKASPLNPLRPPSGGAPYPVPLHHEQWQETVDRVRTDFDLPCRVTVAKDGLQIEI